MKYIMFECKSKEITRHVPVIFPDFIVHKDFAEYVTHALRREHRFDSVIAVSAGFYDPPTMQCSGESETMKLKSKGKADGRIIKMYNYFHGIV